VSDSADNLDDVPFSVFDNSTQRTELYNRAVTAKNSSGALGYILKKYWTEDLFKRTVSHNGFALGDIPIDQRTKELCLLALNTPPVIERNFYESATQFSPEERSDSDMYVKAFGKGHRDFSALPAELQTEARLVQYLQKYKGYHPPQTPVTLRSKDVLIELFKWGQRSFNHNLQLTDVMTLEELSLIGEGI